MTKCIKGVVLYTDAGARVLGLKSDGTPWTVDECFKYCNIRRNEFDNKVRANRLKLKSVLFNPTIEKASDWYRYRENFKEINLTIDNMRKY